MIYHGTITTESIVVHPYDNGHIYQAVELTKHADVNEFSVRLDDGDDTWTWSFSLTNNSDYERVKFNIMDAIFEVEDMAELAEVLDEIFTDGFADILVEDDDCDGDCDNCVHNQ